MSPKRVTKPWPDTLSRYLVLHTAVSYDGRYHLCSRRHFHSRKAAAFWGQLTEGSYTRGMDHTQQDRANPSTRKEQRCAKPFQERADLQHCRRTKSYPHILFNSARHSKMHRGSERLLHLLATGATYVLAGGAAGLLMERSARDEASPAYSLLLAPREVRPFRDEHCCREYTARAAAAAMAGQDQLGAPSSSHFWPMATLLEQPCGPRALVSRSTSAASSAPQSGLSMYSAQARSASLPSAFTPTWCDKPEEFTQTK
jgi:hypothetical protein